ncbi:MAG: hypothetical protein HZB35_12460, partial [Nitrospirae bacterium]|nr:hypothetical protein [Nitrospirota bacterium]
MNQFLQQFPEDNRHRSEVDKLAEQLQREARQRELDQQKQAELARAKADYQAKLEQAWQSVQGAAKKPDLE